VEATLMHDTFAKEARAALPHIPYLARRFREGKRSADGIFTAPPRDWDGEIDVLRIEGGRMNEHASVSPAGAHTRSGGLVLFVSTGDVWGWPRFFVRISCVCRRLFGISSFYRD